MSEHLCHADGCMTPVPRRMFMCRPHWYTLPKAMRDQVWEHYTPGQERNMGLVTPEYLDVTRACIDYVAGSQRSET